MLHRTGFLLISGFLLAAGGFGQIVLPGQQVPGQSPGQYPGQSRFPGGGRNTSTAQKNQAPLTTLTGMLRRVEAGNSIVIEADDKRVVTILLARATKYFRPSGGDAKLSDLQPGDHLSIEATQDDNDYYHAVRVTQTRLGTAEERSTASQPADVSPLAPGANAGNAADSNSDDERPRLHRAANTSAGADSRSADAAVPSAPAAPDPTDSGPPALRRGTARRTSDSGTSTEIADNQAPAAASPSPRPSIHAGEVNGVTRPPEPPKVEAAAGRRAHWRSTGDPVIDMARDAAFSFSDTLPNYTVKQFTTRYAAEAARGRETSWRAVDTVTADVVSENGKESYRNLLIDGKAPKGAIEQTGVWSTGEYSSLVLDILHPETDADFHGKRTTTIVSRPAYRYDFSVEQENSHWHIYSGAESYKPEYAGSIWIDKENYRVLRIELSAKNVPKAFPLDTVESAVDYDYVMISTSKYLLPVHSEALSCDRGTTVCSRNVIEFRNYRRFGADTSITFDAPQ